MKVTVKSCAGCPFFRRSLISALAGGPKAGDCAAPATTPTGELTAANTLPVEDKDTLPRWCPLRLENITITIGNRGTA